jgi:FMN phosphatase YigB (HAD superfamily)
MAESRLKLTKAVIFDIGETIGEQLEFSPTYYHLQFIRQVCGDAYTFSDEEILAAIEHSDKELLTHRIASLDPPVDYLITDEDWIFRAQVLLKELGVTEGIGDKAEQFQELWKDLLRSNRQSVRPGVKEMFIELRSRGYKIGLATNWSDPRDWLGSDVLKLIDSVQYSIVDGYAKPSPYMLIMNAHQMRVNPSRCVYVGNSVTIDVVAAKRAGMAPILLAENPFEEPIVDEDVVVIRNLGELLELLP